MNQSLKTFKATYLKRKIVLCQTKESIKKALVKAKNILDARLEVLSLPGCWTVVSIKEIKPKIKDMTDSMKDIINKLSKMYNKQILDARDGFNLLDSYKGNKSCYNNNFYELTDGTIIQEVYDEFYEEGKMYLYKFGEKEFDGVYVGYTDMNNVMFFTETMMT